MGIRAGAVSQTNRCRTEGREGATQREADDRERCGFVVGRRDAPGVPVGALMETPQEPIHDEVFGELNYDPPTEEWCGEVVFAGRPLDVAIWWYEPTHGP